MAEVQETKPTLSAKGCSGVKLDGDKPMLGKHVLACFPDALKAVALVSEFGANKYTYKGWKTVPDGVDRYSEALVRHIADEFSDAILDAESGLPHAYHTAWNALARLQLMFDAEK